MFGSLVVAHQNGTALRQPGESSLNYPASGWVLTLGSGDWRLPFAAQVRNVVTSRRHTPAGGGVIPFVQRQVLCAVPTSARSCHDHGVQCLLEQLVVIHVRRSHDSGQWSTGAVRHQALFRAIFPAIGGVGTNSAPQNRALPNMQSAACHFHCTPLSSSHSRTRRAHNLLNRPTSHQC